MVGMNPTQTVQGVRPAKLDTDYGTQVPRYSVLVHHFRPSVHSSSFGAVPQAGRYLDTCQLRLPKGTTVSLYCYSILVAIHLHIAIAIVVTIDQSINQSICQSISICFTAKGATTKCSPGLDRLTVHHISIGETMPLAA